MDIENEFLKNAIKRLLYYKELGDKTFEQLEGPDFHFQPNEESNSIALIIQHISGNMISRFTDFLTSDGEKDWRNRDGEFEQNIISKQQYIDLWEKGWKCCIDAINQLTAADLLKSVYIRGEELSVLDAIHRQLAHYPYHIGQIIYVAKIIKDKSWVNLSLPRKRQG